MSAFHSGQLWPAPERVVERRGSASTHMESNHIMIRLNSKTLFALVALAGLLAACSRGANVSQMAVAGPSPSPGIVHTETVPITVPVQASAAKEAEPTMLSGPNAVPTDTRIVVNIPAFRMDVFTNGSLVKSYKIGIGYPQFPLPQGLRKAETIIFNPTWTPPDSPWVNTMNVTPGEVIGAGSKQNPLGPIKIPIGSPSLIHGGKPLAKIGTFASHGCVGMTNAQVKDFARVLADAAHAELTEETMSAYLKTRTKTRTVKLGQLVPVELRYETIVFEDGKLHIYRDVYDQNTNTEDILRAVFVANGASFDSLREQEKVQVLEALNVMSR